MTQDNSPMTIAIIGGGFSGSMVATHLLLGATFPLDIKIIERQPLLGRGVAYGTNYASHLLNVPAGKMSAFPDDPAHLLRWLQTIGSEVKPDTFIPRNLYGQYIQNVLDEAEAKAPNYVHLERLNDEAIALQPETKTATIYLHSGKTIQADKIILALGNFPPSDPPVADRSFYKSSRYIGYAWSADAIAGLSAKEPVLLIGSGLTMIDLVIALQDSGHKGIIHVVSRHGLFPLPHQPATPVPAFLNPETAPKNIRALLRLVRQQLKQNSNSEVNWRAVIDSLRPITQQLWQSLPLEEKRRFLRHLRPYWEVHRHRAAPKIMDAIAQLQQSQQLLVHKGRIQTYRETATGVEVLIRNRQGDDVVIPVSGVINCTGPECDYRKFQHPLIANLLQQGLIRPDSLALGLDVDSNGALVATNGATSELLSTLGSPRKGSLWETTAVPELRVQALALAQNLIKWSKTT
jgi:uncharacterized NAD(P)/FAD-binding protein YdhS